MPGFWRKCLIAFRCLRFGIWAAILLVLAAFGWFNVVGLPGFLKARLVTALHERGVELEFSRMRLRLVRGLICDDVRIGAAETAGGPVLTAREVQLRVKFPALLRRHLQVDGLVLRRGTFTLPLSPTNSLALTNLQSELRFAADDTWALDQFRADFAGASFSLGGEIAHAPEFRNWKMFAGAKTPDHGSVQASLQNFAKALAQIHFDGPPLLNARLNGDARDVHSFTLNVNARAPGVRTPWFAARNLQFAAHLTAPAAAPAIGDSAWGFWTNLQPFRLAWTARGTDLRSGKLDVGAVECDGIWSAPALAVTKLSARLGGGWLEAAAKLDVATRELSFTNNSSFDLHAVATLLTGKTRERLAEIAWTRPPQLRASGALVLPAWNSTASDWRDDIEPGVRLRGEMAFTNALVDGVAPVDSVRTHFSYTNLIWSLPDLELARGRTKLALSGEENEATKNFRCRIAGQVDPEIARPFLTTSNAVRGFELVTLHEPLALVLDASGNLRDFATLSATGWVAVTNFAVRGVAPVDSVRTHFSYTNLIWSLPDLELARGRTKLALSGEENEATKNFRCRIAGQVDPEIARPFLTTSNAVRGFELVTLHEPLALVLDASGNLRDFATLSATGWVAVTNFAVRGQTFESVTADLSYSNLVLDFLRPQMFRAQAAQTMTADAVALDFNARMIFFTNGFSTTEPMVVCRAIGPKTARIIEPYEFLSPPTARVHGQLPLRDISGGRDLAGTDLEFDIIRGAPFRWTKLRSANTTGIIHWQGQLLVLTNLAAEFYGGAAGGFAYFDFRPVGYGCDFNFGFALTNADIRLFAADFPSFKTNRLAGILSGQAVVTDANSKTWRSWNGYGEAWLHDGLLWNIPIFGFVSPLLNTLTPGLDVGNSRATDATARFAMTNGVIFTDSLDIRSLTMRMQYVGTVDLRQNVAARARAQLLRNTPVIGSVLSLVLSPMSKVFECEVSGTLADPKITPAYLPFPKLLAVPRHPIRSLEQIFSPPATNPPAAK